MTRQVILVVSSQPPRLDARVALVRQAGHWPLPASTLRRAIFLACKIRPALVVVDADLSDGRATALVQELRTVPALQDVRVLIMGDVTPRESDVLTRDPAVEVRPPLDAATLRGLLRGVSPAAHHVTRPL